MSFRILIIGESQYEWYAPAWHRALSELGLETLFFNYASKWSRGFLGRVERKWMIGPVLASINRMAIELADDLNPDVVLLYAALPLLPSTVRRLASRSWVTTYCNDDLFGLLGSQVRFRFARRSLVHAQSHHVYRDLNVQDYRSRGVAQVGVLRSFYLPWIDRPPRLSPSDEACFGHDVVFIGHGEPDERVEFIQAMLSKKLPLKIYGSAESWRRYLPNRVYVQLGQIAPLQGVEYRKAIAASRICLGFFSRANRDDYTRRVFEVPAVGGFLLCERTPLMQQLYTEDLEMAYFSSADELIEKCRFYLENETARRSIARAGRQRCLSSGYDVHSRMRQWVSDVRRWMEESAYRR